MSSNVKQSDIPSLRSAVLGAAMLYLEKSTAPHKELMSPFKVAEVAEDRARALGSYCGTHRFGAYVLLWDVACPWYADQDVLIEDLLIKAFPEDHSRTLQQVLTEDILSLPAPWACATSLPGTHRGWGTWVSSTTEQATIALAHNICGRSRHGVGTKDNRGR